MDWGQARFQADLLLAIGQMLKQGRVRCLAPWPRRREMEPRRLDIFPGHMAVIRLPLVHMHMRALIDQLHWGTRLLPEKAPGTQ